ASPTRVLPFPADTVPISFPASPPAHKIRSGDHLIPTTKKSTRYFFLQVRCKNTTTGTDLHYPPQIAFDGSVGFYDSHTFHQGQIQPSSFFRYEKMKMTVLDNHI